MKINSQNSLLMKILYILQLQLLISSHQQNQIYYNLRDKKRELGKLSFHL